MKYKILEISVFISLVFGVYNIYAKNDDSVPLFYSLLPGGQHFYDGDIGEGMAFSISEVSLLTTGLLLNDKLEKNNKTEWNVPLLLAGQIYTIDKWRYIQKIQSRFLQEHPDCQLPIRIDTTPVSKLLLAPFNTKVITSGLVITFVGLGVVDGIVSYSKNKKKYSDISTIVALSKQMDRRAGTYYYESMAFAVSYGAAVSEEMMFRGLFLPLLDYKYGKRTGLIISSLTFGLLHMFNPDIDKPLYLVSQATLAGFVFGYCVQHNDYRLSKVIAAHFWYNFVSMTTTWIINPQENPLGVGVRFKF